MEKYQSTEATIDHVKKVLVDMQRNTSVEILGVSSCILNSNWYCRKNKIQNLHFCLSSFNYYEKAEKIEKQGSQWNWNLDFVYRRISTRLSMITWKMCSLKNRCCPGCESPFCWPIYKAYYIPQKEGDKSEALFVCFSKWSKIVNMNIFRRLPCSND